MIWPWYTGIADSPKSGLGRYLRGKAMTRMMKIQPTFRLTYMSTVTTIGHDEIQADSQEKAEEIFYRRGDEERYDDDYKQIKEPAVEITVENIEEV